MKFKKTTISMAIAVALFDLTACGGGGSGSSSSSDSNPTPSAKTTTINLQAIDGYLENASVCVDLNANGACDEEDIVTQQKTDAKGKIQLVAEGVKLDKFNSLSSVKTLVVAKKDETLSVALDGTKKKLEKDLTLTRTVFPKDFEGNDGKVKNITPYTTLADNTGKIFASEDDYENTALKPIAESLGTSLEAIESDYNDAEKAQHNQEVIAALLASELLVAEDKIEQPVDNLETFLSSDEITDIRNTVETKSDDLAQKEDITEISEGIKNTVEEAEKNNNADDDSGSKNDNSDSKDDSSGSKDDDNNKPKNHKPRSMFSYELNYLKLDAKNESTDEDGDDDIVSNVWTVTDESGNTTMISENKDLEGYKFAKGGEYKITLTVKDKAGEESYFYDVINAEDYPKPSATFDCYPHSESPVFIEEKDDNGISTGNSYYVSHQICEAGQKIADFGYTWKVDEGDGYKCEQDEEKPWLFDCTFAENKSQKISLSVTNQDQTATDNGAPHVLNIVDAFVAKFVDENQKAKIGSISIDSDSNVTKDNCAPKDGCFKNMSLDANFKDVSVLPQGGEYTYTWSYGNGDSAQDSLSLSNGEDKQLDNKTYHYNYPVEYTQTLTIEDSNHRVSKYTTKNRYVQSTAWQKHESSEAGIELVKQPETKIYYTIFPKESENFEVTFIADANVENMTLSDKYYDSSNELVQDSSNMGTIVIDDKNYRVFKTNKSQMKLKNSLYSANISYGNQVESTDIATLTFPYAKQLYGNANIKEGDLVQFGSHTVYNYNSAPTEVTAPDLYFHENPIVWEVMEIDSVSNADYDIATLVEVFNGEGIPQIYNKNNSTVDNINGVFSGLNSNFGKNAKVSYSLPNAAIPNNASDETATKIYSSIDFNKFESNLILQGTEKSTWLLKNQSSAEYKFNKSKESSTNDYWITYPTLFDFADCKDLTNASEPVSTSCNIIFEQNKGFSWTVSSKYQKYWDKDFDKNSFVINHFIAESCNLGESCSNFQGGVLSRPFKNGDSKNVWENKNVNAYFRFKTRVKIPKNNVSAN